MKGEYGQFWDGQAVWKVNLGRDGELARFTVTEHQAAPITSFPFLCHTRAVVASTLPCPLQL